jgi:hypothetical protein
MWREVVDVVKCVFEGVCARVEDNLNLKTGSVTFVVRLQWRFRWAVCEDAVNMHACAALYPLLRYLIRIYYRVTPTAAVLCPHALCSRPRHTQEQMNQ